VSGWLRGVRARLDEAPSESASPTVGQSASSTDALTAEDVGIDADRLAWLLDTDDVAVLDARPGAPRAGGIPGGVAWRPGDAFPADRVVVVVDDVGSRAAALALELRASGVEAWALSGGLGAWRRAGHPVEDPS
jgi:rhodanese-related sulfurtransferase